MRYRDIGLPDRKGDELVREMRALYPSLPVVFATGAGATALQSQSTGAGPSAFVTKPYSEKALISALASIGVQPT